MNKPPTPDDTDALFAIRETYADRDFGEGVRVAERRLALIATATGLTEIVHIQPVDPALIRGQHRD